MISISLPSALASDLDSTARQERRSRSELVREAVRQYVLLARWKSLREKATLRTVAQGLKESDMERLVDEERSARRRWEARFRKGQRKVSLKAKKTGIITEEDVFKAVS